MHYTGGESWTRVLVLEPNAALRSAILTVLAAEHYQVEVCHSLREVVLSANGSSDTVALVAWQAMDGLLAEQHRQSLIELTRRLRLVVMVPRTWARLLQSTDVSRLVAGLIAKPFEADDLLGSVHAALASPVDA
jgi:DNA-binding response OmpR family regulator